MKYIKLFELHREDNFINWLSVKLGKEIVKPIGSGMKATVYELSNGNALKLSIENLYEQNIIMNKNIKGLVKIYSSGSIVVPTRFLNNILGDKISNIKDIPLQHVHTQEPILYYVMMEKVDKPKELIYDIVDVEFMLNKYITNNVNKEPGLRILFNKMEDDEWLVNFLNFIKVEEIDGSGVKLHDVMITLAELLPIFINVKKYYDWKDIHPHQFGRRKNGEVVAFDLGSDQITKKKSEVLKKVNLPKTVIREGILKFKNF